MKQLSINVLTFDELSKEAKKVAKENIQDFLFDVLSFHVKEFKHVGKVYSLNIGDSFYDKYGSILKVENKTFDYIFTLSDGKNYTPNQLYSLINEVISNNAEY